MVTFYQGAPGCQGTPLVTWNQPITEGYSEACFIVRCFTGAVTLLWFIIMSLSDFFFFKYLSKKSDTSDDVAATIRWLPLLNQGEITYSEKVEVHTASDCPKALIVHFAARITAPWHTHPIIHLGQDIPRPASPRLCVAD